MKWLKQSIAVIVIFLIWDIVCRLGIWTTFILPSPQMVFSTFLSMMESGELFEHIGVSAKRVFAGFSISFVLAFCLGMFAGLKPKATVYYDHILEFLRNVPPLSLIALLILWFGIGETPRIIIIVLATFFPIYLNVKKGFQSCDIKLLEVGKTLNFTPIQSFFRIMFPQAIPNILVGMRLGLGYGWRAIVGAEMIAASSGLGFLIWNARQMSRSSAVIVGILTIGIVGILCDKLFSFAMKKIIRGGVDDSWS